MAEYSKGFDTPFKDCVVKKGSEAEKKNLGDQPDAPVAGKTGEQGTVRQKELPKNSLFLGK